MGTEGDAAVTDAVMTGVTVGVGIGVGLTVGLGVGLGVDVGVTVGVGVGRTTTEIPSPTGAAGSDPGTAAGRYRS